jgi:hypothetical protein
MIAMVAVMSSVAFLEALVNEVYLDTVDAETQSTDRLKGVSDEAIAAMRDRWNATPAVEREGVLDSRCSYVRATVAGQDRPHIFV